jgi:hypothetical protein
VSVANKMTTTYEKEPLLAAARPFLRGELAKVDPELPRLLSVLCSAGAGECYHKHGTFMAHLPRRLWGAVRTVPLFLLLQHKSP